MNQEIQNWLHELFSKKFNKDNVTVNDVITDILNSLNIDYNLENGSFVLKKGRQL